VATGRDVIVGVRPEHLVASSASEAAFSGTVELVEHLGADTLVHMRHGEDLLIVRQPHGTMPAPGSAFHVTVEPSRVFLFEPGNGARLS